ncbi:uncharacterized protein CBL_05879 [Carabus blaptoides fortunei]
MWVSVLVVSFSYCVSYRGNMQSAKLCRETLARCRNPRFCVLVFLLLILLYLLDMSQLDIYFIRIKSSMNIDPDNSVQSTAGCRIPLLDPYDKSILKYVFKVKPFTCGGVPPLVESNITTLHIREDILAAYNVTNMTALECAYQPFWRVEPEKDAADTQYGYGDWKTLNSSANVDDEYVIVVCKVNNTEIYKDFHSFVPIKKNETKHTTSAIKLSVLAADFIVEHLNSLLAEYEQCVKLEIDSIVDARLLKSNDYLENKSAIHDYTLIVSTKPGGGLFEATVRCVNCEKSNPFDISGTTFI